MLTYGLRARRQWFYDDSISGYLVHSVPDNRKVRLTGTSLLNSLTELPLTGLPLTGLPLTGLPLTELYVVRISNFVYSVPVNRTVRITGSPVNGSPVNENGVYYCYIPHHWNLRQMRYRSLRQCRCWQHQAEDSPAGFAVGEEEVVEPGRKPEISCPDWIQTCLCWFGFRC